MATAMATTSKTARAEASGVIGTPRDREHTASGPTVRLTAPRNPLPGVFPGQAQNTWRSSGATPHTYAEFHVLILRRREESRARCECALSLVCLWADLRSLLPLEEC